MGHFVIGWLLVAVLVLAGAVPLTALVIQQFVQQQADSKRWHEWEAYKRNPATQAALAVAEGLRQRVGHAVSAAAAQGGADTVLVGSYRNLSFNPAASDVDVKVILGTCRDFAAVREALQAQRFVHMYTAATYALFRLVDGPSGLHVDVSVTARDQPGGQRDDVHCASEVARELDLRGFFMRMARVAVANQKSSAPAPYTTVRHWHPPPSNK